MLLQRDPQIVGLVMAICLHSILLAIGLWDTFCYYQHQPLWTVTHIVQAWSRDFPLLVLLAGIILGHLFFPTGRWQ